MEDINKIILFEQKTVRRVWHNEEWYLSIIDIIQILTDSEKPSQYWHNMKKRDVQLSPICLKLKLKGLDGKTYPSDCANTEGVLRIVMSIPSPKAEPLKLWLAEQGKRAIDETENPELGFERLKEIYQAKGYSNEWIERRLKSITIRKELTDEWQKRGVKEGQEYSILTAEISKGTFGMTPAEYKQFKGIEKENLRDHMTNLELIFTMLGEESTRMTAIEDKAEGFEENHDAARKGGKITGNAMKLYEKQSGRKIVTSENYVQQIKDAQKKGRLTNNENNEDKTGIES